MRDVLSERLSEDALEVLGDTHRVTADEGAVARRDGGGPDDGHGVSVR